MFEQDYIMRQLKETIAVMMKALFRAELDSADAINEQYAAGDDFSALQEQIKIGNIREAEEQLYQQMQFKTAAELLKGYSFYRYLCQLDDDFLEAHGYSRNDIAGGIKRLAAVFGAAHLAELFLP